MVTGPLSGLRVVEFAAQGPGPFAGMLLADLGADVILIERPDGNAIDEALRRDAIFHRGKRSIVLDLKSAEGLSNAQALVGKADCLIEGLRPGVMERLQLGPKECFGRNPRLVYGRMTGWGQHGPLAMAAGIISIISLWRARFGSGRSGGPAFASAHAIGRSRRRRALSGRGPFGWRDARPVQRGGPGR
jgi:alpha-methylacyl-CoA racemase